MIIKFLIITILSILSFSINAQWWESSRTDLKINIVKNVKTDTITFWKKTFDDGIEYSVTNLKCEVDDKKLERELIDRGGKFYVVVYIKTSLLENKDDALRHTNEPTNLSAWVEGCWNPYDDKILLYGKMKKIIEYPFWIDNTWEKTEWLTKNNKENYFGRN